MSGGYPLLSLLPELLSSGSDKPSSSVHSKEFGVLFRPEIEAVPECFWIRHVRNKHMGTSSVIRTHLTGTETLQDES